MSQAMRLGSTVRNGLLLELTSTVEGVLCGQQEIHRKHATDPDQQMFPDLRGFDLIG